MKESIAIKEIKEYTRIKLQEELNKCTEAEKELFARMYVSTKVIAEEKIPWAFKQIENTIARRENTKKEDR